jgi:hypothetical protein
MRLGLFQQGDNQLAFDAGKTVQEIFNGVARFEMIEETFHGDAGAHKNGFATENFRVLDDHFAHVLTLEVEPILRQA